MTWGDLIPILGAIISAICVIYLAIVKRKDDRFDKLAETSGEHTKEIAVLQADVENLKSIRAEIKDIRDKLEKIQENMVTKSDLTPRR